jgi:hypothetical protein
LKVKLQDDASCCWVCHGRFHDVLPKEHPGAFYDVPWGLYKGMSTNNHGQSDIVTHSTNICNKEYRNCCERTFFYTLAIMNLTTPYVRAKQELLFNKPAPAYITVLLNKKESSRE